MFLRIDDDRVVVQLLRARGDRICRRLRRIAYVDPTLVQAHLGGSPLPFVSDPVMRLTDAQRRRVSPVWDLDGVLDEMALAEVGAAIADFLA